MVKFNPLAIIKKYQFLIIGASLLIGIIFYIIFNYNQSYTASAIIEYTNEKAIEGIAPDGSEIDTSEIYSSDVMKEVFLRMGLSYDDYNLDEFRSQVVVESIRSDEEQAVQEAKNEQGEEMEQKPTKYQVSFSLKHDEASQPKVFVRQVLDNMLDVYLEKYGENHLSSGTIVNDVAEIDTADYEYLEIIELIEASVQNAILKLSDYVDAEVEFRSDTTGDSFGDLYRDFSLIVENDIPNIYAYILNNKVAKNQSVLLSKYKNRIENYKISNTGSQEKINDIKEIIASYVKMMRESGNTDITYEYILNEVQEAYYQDKTKPSQENGSQDSFSWEKSDETVEYDVLQENYVKNRSEYENTLIDIAYCEFIIDLYSGEENVENAMFSLPQHESVKPEEGQKITEELLNDIVGKLEDLYNRVTLTSKEYNEYAGAANIGLVSNIVVDENKQILMYSLIAVVAFAVIMTIVVLMIARAGDILNYYLYMDRKLMLPNRAACDRYITKQEKMLLKGHFTCIYIHLENVREKNRDFGRDECDKMMQHFSEQLKKVFTFGNDEFKAVNGLGQFLIFLPNMSAQEAEAHMKYLDSIVSDYNETEECKIEYKYGICETEQDNIFEIRSLMIHAINKISPVNQHSTDKIPNELNAVDSESEKQQNTEDVYAEDLLVRLEKLKNSR